MMSEEKLPEVNFNNIISENSINGVNFANGQIIGDIGDIDVNNVTANENLICITTNNTNRW